MSRKSGLMDGSTLKMVRARKAIYYAYDSRSRVTSVTLKNSSNATLRTNSYTYDDASQVATHTVDSLTTTYGYDDIGQLTSESRTGYSGSYTYDANGNRLTRTVGGVTENYAYDDADKLQDVKVGGVTQKSYGYDAAGRTTSVVSSAGTTSLAYDYEGRISQITYPSTATNTFTYNGLDTRVSKVDSAGTSTYKRDGAGVTAPVLSDASAVYTPGISERRSSTTTYLHSGLKNADSQSGTGQTIAATKQYDAFGNVLSSTGTWKGPFGYAGSFGYQEDSDSSLKLLGHRYYDSSTGRFLTRDPIKDGRNWYVYCENNPINCVDARGLDTLIFNGTTLKHYDSSGHLIDIYPAASGMPGTGKNDQDKKGGPIPEGTYYLSPRKAEFASINPIEISQSGYFPPSKSWGNARVELWQLAGDAKFGRKAFYLHGGTDVGSAGCIDVGPNDEKIIGRLRRINRPDVKVIVDYSNWNGTVPKPAKQW